MSRLILSVFALFFLALSGPVAADEFTVEKWSALERQRQSNDPVSAALTKGYLTGVRDALRFYSRVGRNFQICWPKDHEIDPGLMRNIVAAIRKEHPDIAEPGDNFAYMVVLALANVYPCRN